MSIGGEEIEVDPLEGEEDKERSLVQLNSLIWFIFKFSKTAFEENLLFKLF